MKHECVKNECECCSNFHLRSGPKTQNNKTSIIKNIIVYLILFEVFQLVGYHSANQ